MSLPLSLPLPLSLLPASLVSPSSQIWGRWPRDLRRIARLRSLEHHHSIPHQVKLTKNTLEPADYSFYQRMKPSDVTEVRG